MSRSLQLARRARAILWAVESDLNEIWGPQSLGTTEKPIIAVDWSEIFAFAARILPNQVSVSAGYQSDAVSLHYASLAYLFYKLPCELVLLPPYFWEMRSYLDMLGREAKIFRYREKTRTISNRYSSLHLELQKIGKVEPQLYELRDASDEELQKLRPSQQLLGLLRSVVKEHLPSVFLDLQQETLEFLDTLRSLVFGTSSHPRRMRTLQEFDPELVKACEPALDTWEYFRGYMDNERPDWDRANEVDSFALAYLEQLQHLLFLKGRRVLFATRSVTMFKVMGYHPGSFPGSENNYWDDSRGSFSSARSWEYFAEIGYYLGRETAQDRAAQIALRKAKIEVLVEGLTRAPSSPSRQTKLFADYEEAGLEWGNVRVAFGLEGLAEQPHWKRVQSHEDDLLVGIVRALLSRRQPQEFLDQRAAVAEDVLKKIDEILTQFPLGPRKGGSARIAGRSILGDVLQFLLRPYENLLGFLGERHATEAVALFDLQSTGSTELSERSVKLLAAAATREEGSQHDQNLWISALGFYFLADYRESRYFFGNWLALQDVEVPPGLRLLTCALIADSWVAKGQHRGAFEATRNIWDKKAQLEPVGLTALHILRGRIVVDWIERYAERADDFPHDEEGNVVERTFRVFVEDYVKSGFPDREIRRAAVPILLYGVGRCIPYEDDSEERWKKLAWIIDARPNLRTWEQEMRLWCEEDPRSVELDYLGYALLKSSYIDGGRPVVEQAMEYLDKAERQAKQAGERQILALVRSHQKLAEDRLESEFYR